MSMTINGTSGLVFNDASTQNTAASGFGFKNRILNGNMVLDQRNAGASVTPTSVGVANYTLDRWAAWFAAASKYSVQQNAGSVTPPAGFTNYLGITSLAATSVGSSDYYYIQQIIEGFNSADLGWGTANAQPATISFWVRSSLTGTFGGAIRNSAENRSYPFSYTISTANTWEQKSVTIAGETTGTWLTTNGVGVKIAFSLGMGSTFSGTAGAWASTNYGSATGATSVVGTNGATFYITGVQLEKGSTATSFDYRPYGTEFSLCQRYFQSYATGLDGANLGIGRFYSTTAARGVINLQTTMRTAPSVSYNSAGNFAFGSVGALSSISSTVNTTNFLKFDGTLSSGSSTASYAALLEFNGTSGVVSVSAEL